MTQQIDLTCPCGAVEKYYDTYSALDVKGLRDVFWERHKKHMAQASQQQPQAPAAGGEA